MLHEVLILLFDLSVHILPLHIVFSVISIFFAQVLNAGTTEVIVPDTMVKQGTLIELPISVKTNPNALITPCTVTLSIPKKRMILKDALTKPGTMFTCKNPIITFLSEDSQFRTYSITCPNPLLQEQGILTYLQLEVLAGFETKANINAQSFVIGDSAQSIQQIGGTISFIDPPVVQAQAEGMDSNVPNPFAYTTAFTYYVGKEGEVQFSLFNMLGKLIQEFPAERKSAGRYTFTLAIDDPYNFSSGIYFIRMRTERGLYHMSMVHKK